MLITYVSNNSGGSWWLKDEDWLALEKAGWRVAWVCEEKGDVLGGPDKDGRWLGALAKEASKEFPSPGAAMQEFEEITGEGVSDEGCNCCGPPHSFDWEDGYASGAGCGVAFIVLKLCGVIDWSWWWVTCPFWGPLMVVLAVLLVVVVAAVISERFKF